MASWSPLTRSSGHPGEPPAEPGLGGLGRDRRAVAAPDGGESGAAEDEDGDQKHPCSQHEAVELDTGGGLGPPGDVDREAWGDRDRTQCSEAPAPEGHDQCHRGLDGRPLPTGQAQRAQGRLVDIQLRDLPAEDDADGHAPGEGRHSGEDPQGQFEDVDSVPGSGDLGLQAHHAEQG